MIQYDGHLSANNGCRVESEFVPGRDDIGGLTRCVESSHMAAAQGDTEYARSLSALIESEIIPRLMVAHSSVTPAMAMESSAEIGSDEIEDFAPLVMQIEADALLAHVEAILARGVAIDTVLVDLLAPAARSLGELWEDERCDFVEVTMGFWRLQEVVHELSRRLPARQQAVAEGRRAPTAALPDDRSGVAAKAADEIFRRDDPPTDRLSAAETVDLLQRVKDDWFDTIELTVSCDCHKARSPARASELRNASRSRQV